MKRCDAIRAYVRTFEGTFTTADVAACKRWERDEIGQVIKNMRRQGFVEDVGAGDVTNALLYRNVPKSPVRGWQFGPLLDCFGGCP